MAIRFFQEDVTFSIKKPRKISRWITSVAAAEGYQIKAVNYIFCSDSYLLPINKDYLQHDTLTDIITFDLGDAPGVLTGDIFISIDRVRENAARLDLAFDEELSRVMIHGILHMAGYRDKTVAEKKLMRKKEEAYLSLLLK